MSPLPENVRARLRSSYQKALEAVEGALAPALDEAVAEHVGVHGAGACAADAIDEYAPVAHQANEHTPGESTMGTSAL